MKYLFNLGLLLLSCATIVKAQEKKYEFKVRPFGKTPYSYTPKDTSLVKVFPGNPLLPKQQNNMIIERNLAVIKLSNPLTEIGNNGKGMDIYRSQIDGMPVGIPDANNSASLGMPAYKGSKQ